MPKGTDGMKLEIVGVAAQGEPVAILPRTDGGDGPTPVGIIRAVPQDADIEYLVEARDDGLYALDRAALTARTMKGSLEKFGLG